MMACPNACLPAHHKHKHPRLPATPMIVQFYQRLREGELTEVYLWETRLLPLLGYLSADETTAVRCCCCWGLLVLPPVAASAGAAAVGCCGCSLCWCCFGLPLLP